MSSHNIYFFYYIANIQTNPQLKSVTGILQDIDCSIAFFTKRPITISAAAFLQQSISCMIEAIAADLQAAKLALNGIAHT